MASRARARSTCPAGALSERLRRVSSWRSSAVSGRRGSFRWRDMGHLGARGSPHHYTTARGKRPTRRVGAAAAPGPRAWGSTRDDVSGRPQHPGSPQGGGRGKKGANSKARDEREALGRSRGGYGTKACVIADGLGRAVAFILAPGQAHELPQAIPLLERLPGVPKWVVADRGLSSHAFREHI